MMVFPGFGRGVFLFWKTEEYIEVHYHNVLKCNKRFKALMGLYFYGYKYNICVHNLIGI